MGQPESIGHHERRGAGDRDRGGDRMVDRCRLACHGPRRHGCQLGQGPLTEILLADGAEHLVSYVQGVDPFAQRLHRARGVHAGHEWEAMLHAILQVAL